LSDVVLIKCVCGKRFPVNTWKHPNRRRVFCPFCRTPHENSFFNPEWKPNEKYWEERRKRGFSRPFTLAEMRRRLSGLIRT